MNPEETRLFPVNPPSEGRPSISKPQGHSSFPFSSPDRSPLPLWDAGGNFFQDTHHEKAFLDAFATPEKATATFQKNIFSPNISAENVYIIFREWWVGQWHPSVSPETGIGRRSDTIVSWIHVHSGASSAYQCSGSSTTTIGIQ